MGFYELNILQGKLNSLNDSLSRNSSKLDIQRKRKSELELLVKDIKKVCNSNSDDITSQINKIINNTTEALIGVGSSNTIEIEAKADKEKDIYEDSIMNNALNQLELELRNVDNKISDYQSKITTAKNEITNCQVSIKNERRNIAIDYKNKYDNAEWRYNQAKTAYEKEPTSEQLRINKDNTLKERNVARDNYNRYRGWL